MTSLQTFNARTMSEDSAPRANKDARGHALRVVVADDERPARAFLIEALRRSALPIEIVGEASCGTEAIELIETSRPDLALLDVQMPEVCGFSVAREVGRRRPALHTLFVFVTAYDQYLKRGSGDGRTLGCLLKPVDGALLEEVLRLCRARLSAEASAGG